jgi:hypothetical protein
MSGSSSWDTYQTATFVLDSVLYAINLLTLGMSLQTLLLHKEKLSLRPGRDIKWKVLASNVVLFLLATASLVILYVCHLNEISPGSEAFWGFDWASVGATLSLDLFL